MANLLHIATELRRAALALARVCDGAVEDDGMGYNASDTGFGRSIATVPEESWDEATCFEVHRMLKKYAGQLAAYGVEYGALPVPPKTWRGDLTPAKARRSLKDKADKIQQQQIRDEYRRGDRSLADLREALGKDLYVAIWSDALGIKGTRHEGIALSSPRDADLIDALKSEIDWRDRAWDYNSKRWFVVGGGLVKLPAILERFEFAITDVDRAKLDEAIRKLTRAAEKAQRNAPANIVIEDGRIVARTPYDPDAVAAMRAVAGRRWDGERKVNTFPVDVVTADAILRMADRYGWTVDDTARARLESQGEKARERIEASGAASADLDVPDLAEGFEPYPFQKAGIAYCLDVKRALLGDDTGLGKTPQSILVPHVADTMPVLVICPKATKRHFVREVQRWLPTRSVKMLNGGSATDDNYRADYLVINYDVLTKHLGKLLTIPFRALILDESHYIKNRKAQRSKAVIELSRLPSVEIKLALTATPILNRPVELVNQLDFLGRLNDFGGFWSFVKTYCAAKQVDGYWDMNGASNLDNLAAHLRSKCMVRREKKDVAKELPALQRTEVSVDLDRVEDYRRGLRDLRTWMAQKRGDVRRGDVERSAYVSEALVRIEGLKQIVVDHKLGSCIEWIKSFLEGSEEKIVIFAHHRDVQDRLHSELSCFSPAKIKGGDNDDARAREVSRFQQDPSCRVMVASIQAAGTGLDGLQKAASNVAFCEFPWNSATLYQAESRCHRLGTEADSVNSYWLYAEGTFDEEIIDLIKSKEEMLNAINQGIEVDPKINVVAFFESLLDLDDEDHMDRAEYEDYREYVRER